MSYKIAVASGKGGTGKTTVSLNLLKYLQKSFKGTIRLVDCDVEEPDDVLFFSNPIKKAEREVVQLVPKIDKNKCVFCRKCVDYCQFNAIVIIPPVKFAEVNSSLCHSCGACSIACKHGAITEYPEVIGAVNSYSQGSYLLEEGRLKIGSAMQTMLIKELKEAIPNDVDIIIYDAPPGTSCPVVETISDTDYIILVTEPTPFGLYDMQLMVDLLKQLNKPFGVVVNKAGLGDEKVYQYIKSEGINLLGEVPFSEEYASLYAQGSLYNGVPKEISSCYTDIAEKVKLNAFVNEGNNYFKW